jgi:hypothetical protein
MYEKWEEKWPSRPLTEEEVKEAKGNSEKASTSVKKIVEDVCTHNKIFSMLTHPPQHFSM